MKLLQVHTVQAVQRPDTGNMTNSLLAEHGLSMWWENGMVWVTAADKEIGVPFHNVRYVVREKPLPAQVPLAKAGRR